MIEFPIGIVIDENLACQYLLDILHPKGMSCPNGHALPAEQAPHDRKRAPIFKYRCRKCGSVFNIFTGTILQGARYNCTKIVLMIRGIMQGKTTQKIADELRIDYGNLLGWRHRIQNSAWFISSDVRLPDKETEADETYLNAGEKGVHETRKDNPTRRRGNKRRGRGTMKNDRPPVVGVVGRTSGQVRIKVTENTTQEEVEPEVESKTEPDAFVYTDESEAYEPLSDTPRTHETVSHSEHEWAKDKDGDDENEIHDNTIESVWTGYKNYLRPFRGVHKKYLPQYSAIFEWAYNLKQITPDFLRAVLVPDFTLKTI